VTKTYLARVRGQFPVCPVSLEGKKEMAADAGPLPLVASQSELTCGVSGEWKPSAEDWVREDGEAWLKLERPIFEYRTTIKQQSCVDPRSAVEGPPPRGQVTTVCRLWNHI
jgi:hypothetical protein